MRKVAVAGLVLVALLAGLFAWRSGAAARARAASPGDARAAAPEAPTHPVAGGARTRDDGMIPIEGRVTDGHDDLSPSDGLLRFRVDDGPLSEAEIHEGEFEASAPKGATLSVEEILFGDRKAVATPATVTVPEDGRVEVVCRWVAPTLLRVIGEKGEPIREVEFYETGDYHEWGPGWPQGISASSPIELAGAEGAHRYLVRAPGYAWSPISVFVGLGGERVVRLARAGTLVVRLQPYDPEAELQVNVGTGYWEPDENGRVQVDSLHPGSQPVFAQGGALHGEAEAQVEAGRTTEVVLSIDETSVPEKVPLAGTIEIARGWTEEDEEPRGHMLCPICAWSADDNADVEGPEEDGRWSASGVYPGTWALCLNAWAWVEAVDVGPRGDSDVKLTVPPPCDVEVRLVDEKTGEPIPADGHVSWFARAPDISHELVRSTWAGYEWRAAFPDETGGYRFRAPQGVLSVGYVEVRDDNAPPRAGDAEVELKPGLNRVEIKVAWTCQFELALMDGAMPVPLEVSIEEGTEIAAVRGGGEKLGMYSSGNVLTVHVTDAGRYRVTFPDIEGYEPIAPVEVEVAAGKIAKVEVALRRRVK